MTRQRRIINGFSLMELVVVIGVFGLLAAFLFGILLANNRFYANQTGEVYSISQTRLISDQIAAYGRTAVSLVASFTYNSVNYVSDGDTIVMQMPAIDGSANIINAAYDYVIVTIDPSDSARLLMYLSPAGASARKARSVELTRKLDSLAFTYSPSSPPNTDKFDYYVKINNGGTSPASEYIQGSVTLRNK